MRVWRYECGGARLESNLLIKSCVRHLGSECDVRAFGKVDSDHSNLCALLEMRMRSCAFSGELNLLTNTCIRCLGNESDGGRFGGVDSGRSNLCAFGDMNAVARVFVGVESADKALHPSFRKRM